MSALLDAAALAERLAAAPRLLNLIGFDAEIAAPALRLLASHARETARVKDELDAWRQLAGARGDALAAAAQGMSTPSVTVLAAMSAASRLRVLGVDAATGNRVAAEEPR